MKYRIKIVTRGTGEKKYYPQFKKFLFWRNFKEAAVATSNGTIYHVIYFDDFSAELNPDDKGIYRAELYIKKHKEKIENEKKYNKKEISYKYDV